MSLSSHILKFADEIIGKSGTIKCNLGKGYFTVTITGNPITLKDIIASLEEAEVEFDEWCWNNNDIGMISDIMYNKCTDEYVFYW